MHPLFIAHLVADFLLQPGWLVRYKMKAVAGVALHAAVHAVTMAVFLLPLSLRSTFVVIAVAAAHGLIDQTKIFFARRNGQFAPAFLIDQLAHFVVLFALAPLASASRFWLTESGQGVLSLLAFFAFSFALKNLLDLARLKTGAARFVRLCVVAAPFALFLWGAAFLSSPT